MHYEGNLLLDRIEFGAWAERDTPQSDDLFITSVQVVNFGQVVKGDDVLLALEVLGWQSVQVELLLLH